MSNKHLKEKYNVTFNIVKKIVDEWDPIGLLPFAPEDEYEMEIAGIVTLLNKVDSDEILSDGIGRIFKKSFGESLSKEECFSVAKKILQEIKHEE